MKLPVFFLGLCVLMLSACGPQVQTTKFGSIEIVDPYVETAESGGNTDAYMVLKNTGGEADALVKAEFPDAMDSEIHETKMVGNVMKMTHLDAVDIPANGQVALKPGSFHAMMMGLKKDLKAGDKVKAILTFAKAGSVTVEMEVRNP
jgi:copper(I)-binding protein